MPSAADNHLAFLSLGSNIDPEFNLPAAVAKLADYGLILGVSRAWQSEPVGHRGQADFINGAVLLRTRLSAEELLRGAIPRIERDLCRLRDLTNKNAPRTIDVDLSLYDSDARHVLGHEIPDPHLLTRPFVAIPLAELDGDFAHPVTGESLRAIAQRLSRVDPPLRLRADLRLGGPTSGGLERASLDS